MTHGSGTGKVNSFSNPVTYSIAGNFKMKYKWKICLTFSLDTQSEILPYFHLKVEWTFSRKIILKIYFTNCLLLRGRVLHTFRNYKRITSLGPFCNTDRRERNTYLTLILNLLGKVTFKGNQWANKLQQLHVNKLVSVPFGLENSPFTNLISH